MILDFFLSPTGRRILQASQVWRELRFSLLVPAENWFSVPPGEEILLQGVVDCCIREGGALTVIDYKTDRVSGPALEARRRTMPARYAPTPPLWNGCWASRCGSAFCIFCGKTRRFLSHFQ